MRVVFLFIPVLALPISLIETQHSLIFYPEWLERDAIELAGAVEGRWASVTSLFESDISSVTIYLEYPGVYTNGMADFISKTITVLAFPMPSKFLNFEDWYSTVFTHEMTHVIHLNMRDGIPLLFNALFGLPALDAQYRSPFVESTTIFAESVLNRGGRLENPLIDYLIFAAVKGKWLPSLTRVSRPPVEDFLGYALYYFVPAKFFEYLVEREGTEKVLKFLKEFSKNTFGIGMNGVSKEVFGEKLEDLYEDWKKGIRDFSIPREKIYEEKNVLVLDIWSDGKDLWAAALRYGRERLYGTGGVEIGRIERGKFRRIFRVYGYAGNLRVEKGKVYYLLNFYKGRCCGFFGKYERAIAVWDGKERVLIEGNITSFDVKDGKIVWSEYDPKERVSIIHDGKRVWRVEGLVRELALSDGIYALVYRSGASSLIWKDGKVIEDGRFKYSLKRCDGRICFVAFDESGANVYEISNGLKRLTKNIAVLDFAESNGKLLITTFSTSFPAVGIYEVEKMAKKAGYAPIPKRKNPKVRFRKRDGTLDYIEKTLFPVLHLPLVLPDGTSMAFHLVLGGYSPSHDFYWILSPSLSKDGPDLDSGFLYLGDEIGVMAYRLFDEMNFSLSLKLPRIRTGSDSFIDLSQFYELKEYPMSGFGIAFRKGRFYGSSKIGFGKKGLDWSFGFGADLYFMKASVFLSEEISKLTLTFPIADTDLGTLDPYFHVSHVFSSVSIGFDDFPFIEILIGAETGDFVTYSRNFPKVGIKISESGISLSWGIGL